MTAEQKTQQEDRLSLGEMDAYLAEEVDRANILIHPILDSTNTEAKRLASKGGAHHTVIMAEEQTAGRGRLGRSFYSPKGSGIYMSVILRPTCSMEKSVMITTAASVLVCRAVEQVTGKQCSIKWVNDIYAGERKICGILTEAVANPVTGRIESIVLGIGINFQRKESDFPEDIQGKAGAIYSDDTDVVTRNQLAAALINQLPVLDEMLENGSFLPEYKARSLVLGREVQVVSAAGTKTAMVEDIDNTGGLVVCWEDGSPGVIRTGEVSIRGLFAKE